MTEYVSSYADNVKSFVEQDKLKEALEYIDENDKELGNLSNYYRGEIYSSAEKLIHGIARNIKQAEKYYKNASDSGNSDASYELGMMYYYGELGKVNIKKAVNALKKGISQGSELAMFELANIYYDNQGMEGSTKAIEYYTILTNSDNTFKSTSLLKLGRIYFKGLLGVSVDKDKGIHYLKNSCELDNKNALMDLAYIYYSGDFIKKNLDKALLYAKKSGSSHVLYDEIITKISESK